MLSRSSRSAVTQARTFSTCTPAREALSPSQPRSSYSNEQRAPRQSNYQSNSKPSYQNNRTPFGSSQDQPRPPRWNPTFAQREVMDRRLKGTKPPHLKTLADLSTDEIVSLLRKSLGYKYLSKQVSTSAIPKSLQSQTVALIFNKRSTRTRVASETAAHGLGGQALFLGKDDIQLGVNETMEDTAKVVGSMTDGFMARVARHEDIEELAKHSPVPVINALCDLYHPTQILADLLALFEHFEPNSIPESVGQAQETRIAAHIGRFLDQNVDMASTFKGKKVAWIGDTNNVSNELLVTLPRLGMHFAIASPEGYNKVDPRVWARVEEAKTESLVTLTTSPAEALKDADVVVTDTWISMGQEEESAARLKAFAGYQITNEMVESAGAKKDWVFLHCLPRHQDEVNDEVFYGPRSLVFPEAENRKWTIMAIFDHYIARWAQNGRAASSRSN